MTDDQKTDASVSQRIAALTPERRELLARLVARQKAAQTSGASAARPKAESGPVRQITTALLPSAGVDPNSRTKQFYEAVNHSLNSSEFGALATFLNFGYVADDGPRSAVVRLPPHRLNKNCVDLVLELIGDAPVRRRAVLDVGCGRGGTVSVFNEFFSPSRIVGLDLCGAAVAFCGATHRVPRTWFVNADSEYLPFAAGSFDVVSNVESSHTYPHISRFYCEVWRVLAPAGVFLYTDLLPNERWDDVITELQATGFRVEIQRDITRNVLLSCDTTAAAHRATFTGNHDADVMGNFLGAPGSAVYDQMRSGRSTYRLFRLRRG